MPIILESIQQADQQDRQDLIKIYQDYPFPLADKLDDWLDQQLNSEQQLWAGRFNDRLLVAACISKSHNNWQLEQLCVRKLTRRRSTASQFLTLLARQAHSDNCSLSVNTALAPNAMEPLLEQLGFKQEADFLWRSNRD